MNAVIYHSYDNICIECRPVPAITEHELLVRVHGCGLCGSDILKIVQQAPPPVVLGHELTGTIVERGNAITQFEVGQRVVVAHHVPCGECHYCRHHAYSMCPAFKASNIDPDGFAEYIRVPAVHVQQTTLLLPDTLSPEEGSFTEPLACCVRAVKAIGLPHPTPGDAINRVPTDDDGDPREHGQGGCLQDGDSVVVVGLGSMGLLMLQAVKAIARANGRDIRVYGVDLMPERLRFARNLGADAVFQATSQEQGLRTALAPYTAERGADAIILTVPGMQPFIQALAGIRKGGTINIFAAQAGNIPINLETIYQQELSIISTYSSSPQELRIGLELLASRQVRVDGLISHRLPLERFHEGVRLMRERVALKVYFQIAGE